MRDKFTGRSRGFGFVTFVDDKVISQVIADTHTLDGRSVCCLSFTILSSLLFITELGID
jgi:hypothetical protein